MTNGLGTLKCYFETIFFNSMDLKNQVSILSLGNKVFNIRGEIHKYKPVLKNTRKNLYC